MTHPAGASGYAQADDADAMFSFAHAAYDRHAERRFDEGWLSRAWASSDTRVLVVGDGIVAMDNDRLRLLTPDQSPVGATAYLGEVGGVEHFAVMRDDVPEDLTPVAVRPAGATLDLVHAGLMVQALGLANWHRTHEFCARCGTHSEPAEAGHVRTCPSCGTTHFPRTDPAVIMLVADDEGRALLGRQPSWPEGRFSTLAGFVEPGEALEDAVRREVWEEVGVELAKVRYAASQPWPFPSSLMVGFFAHASSHEVHVDGREMAEGRWFTRDELAELAAAREIRLPGIISISRWLIQQWYGGPLPGSW
ncbi:MAG: NAD(+) diphosphatase [Nocardioidaceae bacterium]